MENRHPNLFAPVIISFILSWLLITTLSLAQDAQVLYVSASDSSCGGQSPCYGDIQSAVDAAPEGAEIRIAAGTYSGTSIREIDGIEYVQVVAITESISLRGGFSESDWENADPTANEALIDAEGHGRGITVYGDGSQHVEISGLAIRNGDYSGLGNPEGESGMGCFRTGGDCAGGLFTYEVSIVLRDMRFEDNLAGGTSNYSDGGGAYFWRVAAGSRIENVQFINNRAESIGGFGGALVVTGGAGIEIVDSLFENNFAEVNGGSIYLFQPSSQVTIERAQFIGNSSVGEGGAIEARLALDGVGLDIKQTEFRRNETFLRGAAVNIVKQGSGLTEVEFTNVIAAENSTLATGGEASVICVEGGSDNAIEVDLKQITIANNPGLNAFSLINQSGKDIHLMTRNLLIVNAEAPFSVQAEGAGANYIFQQNSLYNDIEQLAIISGDANNFTTLHLQTGDALLNETYHLMAGSAAIDSGVPVEVDVDIDGDTRPQGAGFDIGADEYAGE